MDASKRIQELRGSAEENADARSAPDEGSLSLTVSGGGIDLTLSPGEMVALTGPSGSGKTTLLMRIAGLLPSDETSIDIGGVPVHAWQEEDLRSRICLLPQRSALVAGTIRENLEMSGETDEDRLSEVLEAVLLKDELSERGGLDLRLGEFGSGLSGGQSRRLCLARCLLRWPDLLLLDEPVEGLSDDMAAAVLENVRTYLPEASMLVCLHKHFDGPIFDLQYDLHQ